MSLSCQIRVFNPCEEAFEPLEEVKGIIKYTIYEDITVKRIIISLKGNGTLDLEGKTKRRFREDYVDLDYIVQEEFKGFTLSAGTYEQQFTFKLPDNIPPSFETKQTNSRHIIDCNIEYYIRIKFDRGYLRADKTFKKNIKVKSNVVPKLSRELVTIKQTKYLRGMMSAFTGKVNIGAAIENSVLKTGDTIKFHYKVHNDTNVQLDGVVTKFVELYSFKPNRPLINSKCRFDIENTAAESNIIDVGRTIMNSVEIKVPPNIFSLENSTLVTREYYVLMIIKLPFPYPKKVLKIPVQINNDVRICEEDPMEMAVESGSSNEITFYPPPSYWEAMGEIILEDEET